MPLPRISLGEAFAVAVLVCGLFAALRFASGIFSASIGLLVGLLVLYAILAAIFDRGPARAAAGGFAVAAALYGLAFVVSGAYAHRARAMQGERRVSALRAPDATHDPETNTGG